MSLSSEIRNRRKREQERQDEQLPADAECDQARREELHWCMDPEDWDEPSSDRSDQ